MAFDPLYKFTIQNASGEYMTAKQNADASWRILYSPEVKFLENSPEGWFDTKILYERDHSYLGVFRSGISDFSFSGEARAVISSLWSAGGINAYGVLTIYKFKSDISGFTYPIYYQAPLDFKTCKNLMQQRKLEIGLLSSDLIRDLHAYGDTVFNIPIWKAAPRGHWTPYYNNVWVLDDGCKLLYNATFTSAATPTKPLQYSGSNSLNGFFKGVAPHKHTIPTMSPYNIVQNNGATTYIGNDILQPFLIQGNQGPGAENVVNETDFNGTNKSRPYTMNNFTLKDILPGASGTIQMDVNFTGTFAPYNGVVGQIQTITVDLGGVGYVAGDIFSISGGIETAYGIVNSVSGGGVATSVSILSGAQGAGYSISTGISTSLGGFGSGLTVNITGILTGLNYITLTTHHTVILNDAYIGFGIFEIQNNDIPTLGTTGNYKAGFDNGHGCVWKWNIPIGIPSTAGGTVTYNFPSGADTSFNSGPVPITLHENCVYVFCLIPDATIGSLTETDTIQFGFSDLGFSFASKKDYGISGVPIPAPALNPSIYAGYRLHQCFELLTSFLASKRSDIYGFPVVPAISPYTAVSNYLSNPLLPPVGDAIPYNVVITSEYCMHDLQGQSYISLSLNQLFDYCKKQWGCGLGIVGNTITMENLRHYFDASTMILDLGYTVTAFEIEQESMDVGSNLKLGYSKADTNTDFGVDSFCTELYFDTPAAVMPKIMDYEETSIVSDQYQKEKARAQRVIQPIGTSYDPANPSNNQNAFALYCCSNDTGFSLPGGGYDLQPIDPNNNAVSGVTPYRVLMYNGISVPGIAQSNDNTAATQPYINGLYYPDTAQNIPLAPCRALDRDLGALLHSVLDDMDGEYLVFRQTGVMQYNNVALALSGIESNLKVGDAAGAANVITEMSDKLIGNLPPKLFRNRKMRVTSTSGADLYNALNANPNGYIRFYWQNEGIGYTEWKFFMTKAEIQATPNGNVAAVFEGWPTPDMVV